MVKDIIVDNLENLASPPQPASRQLKETLPKVSSEVKDRMQAERKRLGLKWDEYFNKMVGVVTQKSPAPVIDNTLPAGLRPDLNVGGGISIAPLLMSQESKEKFVNEYYEWLVDSIGLKRKKVQAEMEEEFGEEGGNMSSKLVDKVMEMQALDKLVEGMNKSKEGEKNMNMDVLLMMMLMNQQKQTPQQQQTMDPMMMMVLMQSMQKETPKDETSKLLMQMYQNQLQGEQSKNKELVGSLFQKQKEDEQRRKEEERDQFQRETLTQQQQVMLAFKDEMKNAFSGLIDQHQKDLDYIKQQNDFGKSLDRAKTIFGDIAEFLEAAKALGVSKGLSGEEASRAVSEATGEKNELMMSIIKKGLDYITSQTAGAGASVPTPPPVSTPPPPPKASPRPVPEVKPPKPINFIEPKKE